MVKATDEGTPPKSTQTNVVVLITRDQYAPEFKGAPYRANNVEETRKTGERVFQVSATDKDQKVKTSLT